MDIELTPEEQSALEQYLLDLDNALDTCNKYCGLESGVYTTDENCPLGNSSVCMHSSLWNRRETLLNNPYARKIQARLLIKENSELEEPLGPLEE